MIFEDGNCPGYVYEGDQDDWNWLVNEGGSPFLVNGNRVSAEGEVLVNDGEKEEWVWPILYPSKKPG